ncbi:MAG TPA: hypothetical protein VGG84_00785 [Gemmatimonadaceae bacterium]|jgi:hypothetical protein
MTKSIFFENISQPPISIGAFYVRLLRHGGYVTGLIAISAFVGTVGYHELAHFSWIDSFLNACMLLGGMGPVGELPNKASKLFAAFFALYSGLVFLVAAGLLLAPVFHRVLHRFHWEVEGRR